MTKHECEHYDSAVFKSTWDWTQANDGYELFMTYKHHLATFNAYGLRMTSKNCKESELYEVVKIPVDSVGKAPGSWITQRLNEMRGIIDNADSQTN